MANFKSVLGEIKRYYERYLCGYFVLGRVPRVVNMHVKFQKEGTKFYRAYWELAWALSQYFDVIVYKDKTLTNRNEVINSYTVAGHPDDCDYFIDHFQNIYDAIEDQLCVENHKARLKSIYHRRDARKRGVNTTQYPKLVNNRINYIKLSITTIQSLLEKKGRLPNNRNKELERALLLEEQRMLSSKPNKVKINGHFSGKSFRHISPSPKGT